jgi:hypothetical protein
LLLKILPLLTAKPTISVDYLAEYNKVTKPLDYDPNQNAAPYYDKAFEAFIEFPEAVEELRQAWPGDMNETELNTLKNWLSSNSEALAHLKQAAQQPYCWIERKSTGNEIFNIEIPEISNIRNVVWCLCSQAKLHALEGKVEQAFEQVIELYKMGSHYSGPITLVEQLVGIAICQLSFNAAYQILDRIDVNSDIMDIFQTKLEQQLQQAKSLNFSIGENIYSLDSGQRMFTDDGSGDGQLIPSKLYKLKKESPLTPSICYAKAIMICLNHPGRRETIQLQQKIYKNLDTLVKQTPWQLRQQGTSYDDQIQKMTEGNYLLADATASMGRLCEIYQRKKTSGEALIATLALLRYKIDNGIYHSSLQELVASGYLKNIPADPYSGKPLIYKPIGDNFTLYSVGADFNDNDGIPSNWGEDEEGGDQVFWPVERY